MDLEWIGYCGVSCAGCPDLARGKCPGCRQTRWPEGDACRPVACCREKKLDVCGQCGDFPCEMMAEFYEESEGHREALKRMCRLRQEERI